MINKCIKLMGEQCKTGCIKVGVRPLEYCPFKDDCSLKNCACYKQVK